MQKRHANITTVVLTEKNRLIDDDHLAKRPSFLTDLHLKYLETSSVTVLNTIPFIDILCISISMIRLLVEVVILRIFSTITTSNIAQKMKTTGMSMSANLIRLRYFSEFSSVIRFSSSPGKSVKKTTTCTRMVDGKKIVTKKTEDNGEEITEVFEDSILKERLINGSPVEFAA